MAQPAFWAAHLRQVVSGPLSSGDAEHLDSALGLSTDSVETFYIEKLADETAWPVFQLPMPGSYSIEVEYANAPEDHEIVYRLRHPRWQHGVLLGKGGGHWLLPGLRWHELVAISNATHESLKAPAILLLLPVTWLTGTDAPHEVHDCLLRASDELNLNAGCTGEKIAEQLIQDSRSDVQWFEDSMIGWVNDGINSCRNPDSPATVPEVDYRRIRTFFDVLEV